MVNVKKHSRSIIIALLVLLVLALVSLLPFFPYETWAESIDTRAITEQELSGIRSEIESLYNSGTVLDAINEKQAEISGIQLMAEEADKTVTISKAKILYDLDEKPTYLLTEFAEGGYAIRFREGETFVERNESSNSIYSTSNVLDYRCYYAGPGQYFYKRDGKTYEVRTGAEVIFDKSGDDEIEETNRQILKERESGIMTTSLIDEGYTLLNFKKKEMTMMDAIRGVYFYGLSEYNTTFLKLDSSTMWTSQHDNECVKYKLNKDKSLYYNAGGQDMLFGDNNYGSCVLVAIGMVLQLYDRTDWCDVVPSNTSAWESIQYKYPYTDKFANHPNLDPNKKDAERLHQYLISLAHLNVKPDDDETYGISSSKISGIVNQYASNMGYDKKIKGKNALAISVKSLIGKEGYPMIASSGGKPFSYTYPVYVNGSYVDMPGKTNGGHSFIAYGYKNNDYVCHMGWHGEGGYASAIVNSKYIKDWKYIDIL